MQVLFPGYVRNLVPQVLQKHVDVTTVSGAYSQVRRGPLRQQEGGPAERSCTPAARQHCCSRMLGRQYRVPLPAGAGLTGRIRQSLRSEQPEKCSVEFCFGLHCIFPGAF